MDILKTAIEWAKAEVFSSFVFVAFGVIFIASSIGFWQLGKTEVAKAFIYPTLVAGALLLAAGISFVRSNKNRVANFETEYKANPTLFITSEITRTEKTMKEYEHIALKVFPAVIALISLLLIFINTPIWRAIGITIIALLLVMVIIDLNANARIKTYHKQLVLNQQ